MPQTEVLIELNTRINEFAPDSLEKITTQHLCPRWPLTLPAELQGRMEAQDFESFMGQLNEATLKQGEKHLQPEVEFWHTMGKYPCLWACCCYWFIQIFNLGFRKNVVFRDSIAQWRRVVEEHNKSNPSAAVFWEFRMDVEEAAGAAGPQQDGSLPYITYWMVAKLGDAPAAAPVAQVMGQPSQPGMVQ